MKINRQQLRKIINESTNNTDIEDVLAKTKRFLDAFDKFMMAFSRFIRNAWYNDKRTHGMKEPYVELKKTMELAIEDVDLSIIKSSIAVIITEFNIHISSRKIENIKMLGHQVIKEIDSILSSEL